MSRALSLFLCNEYLQTTAVSKYIVQVHVSFCQKLFADGLGLPLVLNWHKNFRKLLLCSILVIYPGHLWHDVVLNWSTLNGPLSERELCYCLYILLLYVHGDLFPNVNEFVRVTRRVSALRYLLHQSIRRGVSSRKFFYYMGKETLKLFSL